MADSGPLDDRTDDSTASDEAGELTTGDTVDDHTQSSESGFREVEVPLRVYKTVVVFSTMFAVGLVVGGFIVLDVATQRARLPLSDIDPVLALLGLAMLIGGAAVYAFATRFSAPGMGKPKDGGDESSDNG